MSRERWLIASVRDLPYSECHQLLVNVINYCHQLLHSECHQLM